MLWRCGSLRRRCRTRIALWSGLRTFRLLRWRRVAAAIARGRTIHLPIGAGIISAYLGRLGRGRRRMRNVRVAARLMCRLVHSRLGRIRSRVVASKSRWHRSLCPVWTASTNSGAYLLVRNRSIAASILVQRAILLQRRCSGAIRIDSRRPWHGSHSAGVIRLLCRGIAILVWRIVFVSGTSSVVATRSLSPLTRI